MAVSVAAATPFPPLLSLLPPPLSAAAVAVAATNTATAAAVANADDQITAALPATTPLLVEVALTTAPTRPMSTIMARTAAATAVARTAWTMTTIFAAPLTHGCGHDR